MDEILASIRRIISEDDASIAGPIGLGAPVDLDDDVLVLTERAPAEFPEPVVSYAAPSTAPDFAAEIEPIVALETAAAAAASFQKLSFVVGNSTPVSRMSVTSAGPTLEDITRDLMRPMLQSWLDANLPAIVRARVDEEVERIARGRVR
jgi:hypothetical protein